MTLRKPISDNDAVEGRAGEPGGAVGRGALGACSLRDYYTFIHCCAKQVLLLPAFVRVSVCLSVFSSK